MGMMMRVCCVLFTLFCVSGAGYPPAVYSKPTYAHLIHKHQPVAPVTEIGTVKESVYVTAYETVTARHEVIVTDTVEVTATTTIYPSPVTITEKVYVTQTALVTVEASPITVTQQIISTQEPYTVTVTDKVTVTSNPASIIPVATAMPGEVTPISIQKPAVPIIIVEKPISASAVGGPAAPVRVDTSRTHEGFTCNTEGHFQDPKDCQFFFVCGSGQLTGYRQDCGDGLAFNQEYGVCDYKHNVPCNRVTLVRESEVVTGSNVPLHSGTFLYQGKAGQVATVDGVDITKPVGVPAVPQIAVGPVRQAPVGPVPQFVALRPFPNVAVRPVQRVVATGAIQNVAVKPFTKVVVRVRPVKNVVLRPAHNVAVRPLQSVAVRPVQTDSNQIVTSNLRPAAVNSGTFLFQDNRLGQQPVITRLVREELLPVDVGNTFDTRTIQIRNSPLSR